MIYYLKSDSLQNKSQPMVNRNSPKDRWIIYIIFKLCVKKYCKWCKAQKPHKESKK